MALQTERQKIAHLLRRFGLGASEAELDYYGKGGVSGAIDLLLNYEAIEDPEVEVEAFKQKQNNNVPMPLLQTWWGVRLLTTKRPLQEKMVLFWHDHFATSAQKVNGSMLLHDQNQVFRTHATAKFQDLLTAVSKDPAMLFWLDNQYNVKGKPNENFAREIMELFTLGVGNYTEKDIQEAARAFTGWTIQRRAGRPVETPNGKLPRQVQFVFNRRQHDTESKDILGNKGNFDGDDVIGILCGNPQTSKYITTKLWEFFVYPDPPNGTIDALAAKFRNSGLDLKVLLRAIMESPEFFSAKAERALYKNPVEFCISTLRQLGMGSTMEKEALLDADGLLIRGKALPVQAGLQAMKSMGLEIFFPPDVAGWDHGPNWITSATMVERIQWADRMFPSDARPARGKAVFRYPIFNLIRSNPTHENLVETLVSVFDAQVSPEKRKALEAAAAKSGPLTERNASAAANAVARLIFGTPEFQFN